MGANPNADIDGSHAEARAHIERLLGAVDDDIRHEHERQKAARLDIEVMRDRLDAIESFCSRVSIATGLPFVPKAPKTLRALSDAEVAQRLSSVVPKP